MSRLIDADKLKTHHVGTELDTDLEVYLTSTIEEAPTVDVISKEKLNLMLKEIESCPITYISEIITRPRILEIIRKYID